jgi:hypothetical protein
MKGQGTEPFAVNGSSTTGNRATTARMQPDDAPTPIVVLPPDWETKITRTIRQAMPRCSFKTVQAVAYAEIDRIRSWMIPDPDERR